MVDLSFPIVLAIAVLVDPLVIPVWMILRSFRVSAQFLFDAVKKTSFPAYVPFGWLYHPGKAGRRGRIMVLCPARCRDEGFPAEEGVSGYAEPGFRFGAGYRSGDEFA